MGIEGTVALASLAAAITTVLIATKVIAVPESLALISTIVNPVGIAALFIAAIYFTILAISSYQQMHKNEEINGAETSGNVEKVTIENVRKEIEAKTKDLATKADLDKKLNSDDFNEKVKSSLNDPSIVKVFKDKVLETEKA
ncbi:hypothetical protein [Wolbachia endosymbiont of Atemnus politus]|uniref:hypothetical protein n=1 Tax=Wolbachia endosymbiont of Atemnus politus TaxID=2682840 RepID=UPI001FE81ADD|nr:hypothetical protein [Wolbachia endosymbiont of Atemnus politus]